MSRPLFLICRTHSPSIRQLSWSKWRLATIDPAMGQPSATCRDLARSGLAVYVPTWLAITSRVRAAVSQMNGFRATMQAV